MTERADLMAENLKVELPGGGTIQLLALEEVELWTSSCERYLQDYNLVKQNDKVLVGTILSQQVAIFRAQQALNGFSPGFTEAGNPTGTYTRVDMKAGVLKESFTILQKAAVEIRELEKALGIDKRTREAGSQHTVADYIKTLKKAAHEYGVHITKRTKAYEKFVMELRWRLRLLQNGDEEDRGYHDLSPDKVIDWCRQQLIDLEAVDKKYALEKGKIYTGRL